MYYSFQSSPRRGPLHAMVVAALFMSAVLFGISGIEGMLYPMLYQFLSVICLVAAVYLVTRYSLRVYRYAVEPNGITDAGGVEQYDLVITETVGKKIRVAARVGLRDIGDMAIIRRKDKDAAHRDAKSKLCQGKTVFRYINTPALSDECCLEMPEEGAVLIIPWDKHMEAILRGAKMKMNPPAYDNFKD